MPPPCPLQSQRCRVVVVVVFVVLVFLAKAVIFASQEEALERRTEEPGGDRYAGAAGTYIYGEEGRVAAILEDKATMATATAANPTSTATKTTTATMTTGYDDDGNDDGSRRQ